MNLGYNFLRSLELYRFIIFLLDCGEANHLYCSQLRFVYLWGNYGRGSELR